MTNIWWFYSDFVFLHLILTVILHDFKGNAKEYPFF